MRHAHPGAMAFDALHACDYLAYAYLQIGEDEKVRQVTDELSAVKALDVENFAGYYALAAVPARFALERKRWADAAALTVRPAEFPVGSLCVRGGRDVVRACSRRGARWRSGPGAQPMSSG